MKYHLDSNTIEIPQSVSKNAITLSNIHIHEIYD